MFMAGFLGFGVGSAAPSPVGVGLMTFVYIFVKDWPRLTHDPTESSEFSEFPRSARVMGVTGKYLGRSGGGRP